MLPKLLRTECLIGGKWVGSKSGKTFEVINPATEEVLASVPRMGHEDVQTIQSSRKCSVHLVNHKHLHLRGTFQ